MTSIKRLKRRLSQRRHAGTSAGVQVHTRRPGVFRIGFVYEHIGGHVTFARTVQEAAAGRDDVELVTMPLHFPSETRFERLPVLSRNWTLRASLRTRRLVKPLLAELDAVLVHTQTAAQACHGIARTVPLVVSVDATPINYDVIGVHYDHQTAGRRTELVKRHVTGVAFRRAARVVAWSAWVRTSLIDDYGVPPQRIALVPGGVVLAPKTDRRAQAQAPVRLLFIGRDFQAKGGEDLLAALEGLDGYELDIVTLTPVRLPSTGVVRVHTGLTPGDPLIERLLSEADIAVLPTRGDSSPFAVLEAMSHSLAVITTRVGAIAEIVEHNTCGLLIEPGDVVALREHLVATMADPELRRSLGEAAHRRIEAQYQASVNADRVLLEVLKVISIGAAAPASGQQSPA